MFSLLRVTDKKSSPARRTAGPLDVRAIGGNRTRCLRFRHNCALSDELQPHAEWKLDSSVRSCDSVFFSVDIDDRFCFVITVLNTKAPQNNFRGAFVLFNL